MNCPVCEKENVFCPFCKTKITDIGQLVCHGTWHNHRHCKNDENLNLLEIWDVLKANKESK